MRAALLALLIVSGVSSHGALAAVDAVAPPAAAPTNAVPTARAPDEIDAVVARLQAAARSSPDALQALPMETVQQLLAFINSDPARAGLRAPLLEALYLGGWDPGFANPDGYWMTLIRHRLDEGRVEEAAKIAHSVDAPALLVLMRIEKRYDVITQQDPAFFDPLAGGERQLAALDRYRTRHPESLTAVNGAAYVLIQLGRNGAALALLDQAIKDAYPPGKAASRFTDLEEFNWTLEYRATALRMLGRRDEADAQLREAGKRQERGRQNVSQRLNAAERANWAGRPTEALKLIKAAGSAMSGYGHTVKEANLVCAHAQLANETRMREALTTLRAHGSDGPVNLLQAQLCASDLDGAAATIVRGVSDPKTRAGFLTLLQTYRPGGDTVRADPSAASDLPFETLWLERRNQVAARPDVAAAIDAVGRLEEFALYEQH